MAVGLATTLIIFLVLQTFLIAAALGSGNYIDGTPGGIPAGRLKLFSLGVVALATAIGAWVTARGLRRADVERPGVRRVAPIATGPVVLGIVVNALSGEAGLTGALLVVVAAAVGTAAGAFVGSSR